MTHDTGAAPCVENDLLTLAICKPQIRSAASPGDIIFGFGSRRHQERLIYAAVVMDKIERAEYYRRPEFAARSDCIYEIAGEKARVKKGARFHQDGSAIRQDIGPGFSKAKVLISRDFRYFGKSGTDAYKATFPLIGQAVADLARGHRVHHSPALRSALSRLKGWIWATHPQMVNGRPTDAKPCPGKGRSASQPARVRIKHDGSMPKEHKINIEASRLLAEFLHRDDLQKNWHRLCLTIDGFRSRFGCWPKRAIVSRVLYDGIRRIFSKRTFALIESKIALVPEDNLVNRVGAFIMAEDDDGRAFRYGHDGHDWPPPDIDADRWLGVCPDLFDK